MKATIYWTIQHLHRTRQELGFRAACWWLSQQVDFLEWRLQVEALLRPVPSDLLSPSIDQEGCYPARRVLTTP